MRHSRYSTAIYLILALVVLAGLTYWATGTHDRFEMSLHLEEHSRDPFNIDADTRKIVSLEPEAERAGLVKGALIESLNGAPYTGEAQWAAIANSGKPGELVFVGFRRPDGSARGALITLVAGQPQPGAPQGPGEMLQQLVLFGLLPLLCMLIGYWVVFTKPQEPNAWLLLVLLLFPEVVFGSGMGMATGGWLFFRGLYWYSLQILGPLALLLFAVYFPERAHIDVRLPWLKWMILGPALLCGLLDLRHVYGQLYLAGNPSWLIRVWKTHRMIQVSVENAVHRFLFSKNRDGIQIKMPPRCLHFLLLLEKNLQRELHLSREVLLR